jgi:hypothetical protein
MDRLLTLNEAAEFFGLDPESFQVLVQKYNIPHYKIAGKFIRFSQNELERYRSKIKEFQKSSGKKNLPGIKQTRPLEYKRKDLNWEVKLYEFLKFNDFYIISFIIILFLLYYIFKY